MLHERVLILLSTVIIIIIVRIPVGMTIKQSDRSKLFNFIKGSLDPQSGYYNGSGIIIILMYVARVLCHFAHVHSISFYGSGVLYGQLNKRWKLFLPSLVACSISSMFLLLLLLFVRGLFIFHNSIFIAEFDLLRPPLNAPLSYKSTGRRWCSSGDLTMYSRQVNLSLAQESNR